MMGKFWRSLKVGRMTEYMSLPPVDDFAGAIVKLVTARLRKGK